MSAHASRRRYGVVDGHYPSGHYPDCLLRLPETISNVKTFLCESWITIGMGTAMAGRTDKD